MDCNNGNEEAGCNYRGITIQWRGRKGNEAMHKLPLKRLALLTICLTVLAFPARNGRAELPDGLEVEEIDLSVLTNGEAEEEEEINPAREAFIEEIIALVKKL